MLIVWLRMLVLLLASEYTRVHMVVLALALALALIRLPMANALLSEFAKTIAIVLAPRRNAHSEAKRGVSDPGRGPPLQHCQAHGVCATNKMKFVCIHSVSVFGSMHAGRIKPERVCGNGRPPLPCYTCTEIDMYGLCELRFNITAVRFELNAIILYLTYEQKIYD